ncbi:MAG: hypothetical protein J6R22_00550 [Alphaproteobacteria bacterium]|nr:hypothetical protein [Alphaproteobacteria bacterium]
MYLKTLEKLVEYVYGDMNPNKFNKIIEEMLDQYMGQFKCRKQSDNIWAEELEDWNDDSRLPIKHIPQEFFEIKTHKRHIFSKPVNKIIQKTTSHDIIKGLLEKQDKTVVGLFAEQCDDLRKKARSKARNFIDKQKELQRQKNYTKRRENHKSNTENLQTICLVHATSFYPQKNSDGRYVIETTAHATNYLLPRPTVHFTCNHIVESHTEGNWAHSPYIILAPLCDVIKENGNPEVFGAVDTFFLPDQDKGLLLPDSVMIVEPSDRLPADKLHIITKNNHVYYRNCDFTDEHKRKLGTNSDDNILLAQLSRDYATQQIMAQNGFDYQDGNVISNETILEKYRNIAAEQGFTPGGKYAHVSSDSYIDPARYHIEAAILSIEKGEKISPDTKEEVTKWVEKYILGDEVPTKLYYHNRKINYVVDGFNAARDRLIKSMKEKIKSKEDLKAYLDAIQVRESGSKLG